MSIIKKVKSIFNKKNTASIAPETYATSMPMREKEKIIYGEDNIVKQRLYEKWSCKDKWALYDEGIPLLLGIEPGTKPSEEGVGQKINDLFNHAKDCINKKLLVVINKDLPEKQWEVKPVDLYCWATVSRITVPDELTYLMEFVLQTVKSPEIKRHRDFEAGPDKDDSQYQRHRELTLGATVSLLVNAPELCRNRKDKVKAQLIAGQILTNAELWFAKEKPLLAQSAMEDLINQYIKAIDIS